MTAINYVRNLAGGCVVSARGCRSLAPPSPAGTAARPSAPVGSGVLLSLAPTLPRIRYKVRPAWLVGGDSGTKFALHGLLAVTAVQSSPCSGKTRQIVPFWVSRASFVPPWHPPRSQLSALRRPWAPRPATEPRSPPWLCGLAASFTSEVGVLHYTKPSGACHRRVGASCSAIPPVWWR